MNPDELKKKIEEEIRQLLKELQDGTLDRKTLEAALKKLQAQLRDMPPYQPNLD
ncbi:MAG: hypothetical protein M3O26_16520 [Pseudomonadota bacterium]|nr:hypothetical protein [Pseudomonadota bacterium]